MIEKKRAGLRLRFFYTAVRRLLPLYVKKYDFTTDVFEGTDEPYLVIANHLTELDAPMLSMAFPEQMYYVVGEHFTRTPWGRLFVFINDSIFEFKGSSAVSTAREIIKKIRSGANVMIFAEGCRSFNGETLKLPESIGKLVKSTGGGLATYRFEGAYFAAPRWAKTGRVGPIRGRIANYYSSEDIKSMSKDELTDAINRDIHENAYERQRRDMHEYRGKDLAEGLENYLIKCPSCGALDSMVTNGDDFECGCCGQKGRYNKFGFLEGEGLRFDSVYDWGVWCEKEIEKEIEGADPEIPVYSDDDVVLYELTQDHRKVERGRGRVEAFKDRIVIRTDEEDIVFDYKGVPPMEMMFGRTLMLSYEGRHYELTGDSFKALKYTILHRCSGAV